MEYMDQFLEGDCEELLRDLPDNSVIERFCTPEGAIDWGKLVQFNSGNYNLDSFSP